MLKNARNSSLHPVRNVSCLGHSAGMWGLPDKTPELVIVNLLYGREPFTRTWLSSRFSRGCSLANRGDQNWCVGINFYKQWVKRQLSQTSKTEIACVQSLEKHCLWNQHINRPDLEFCHLQFTFVAWNRYSVSPDFPIYTIQAVIVPTYGHGEDWTEQCI